MNLNSFPQAFLLLVVILTVTVLLVRLFPAPSPMARQSPQDWLDKQQPRCKHCGERNFWHAFECSTCLYLEPSWNAAADLYPRPLEPKFFAEETPQ